jgi:hypothetical protein
MSANPADEARERLNYFNGQRLAAADFRAEQGYHMGMRRVLNQSLYSPGVVVGLEVEKDPVNKHRVIVRHGLAFDHLGREIFLPQDSFVLAMGSPSTTKGLVFGNLLVVSYREQRRHPVSDGCAVAAPCQPCGGDLAWGAPSRIIADVVFEFLDSWPADDSGKVVLAQLELSKTCEVERVLPGVRKYAVPVKPQQVRSASLEGEKDIDQSNPKVLFFHVQGGYPESVTLYLRARKFSTLYYTELGRHNHPATVTINNKSIVLTHTHTASAATQTDPAGGHGHDLLVDIKEAEGDPRGVDMQDVSDCDWRSEQIRAVDDHTHTITQMQIEDWVKVDSHNHTGAAIVNNNGVLDISARTGNKTALTFFPRLKVFLDGQPITKLITDQLEAKPGQAGQWATVDSANQPCIKGASLMQPDGSGEIDLLKLGIEIGMGRHKLEFRIDEPDVGGNVQYNLYVS